MKKIILLLVVSSACIQSIRAAEVIVKSPVLDRGKLLAALRLKTPLSIALCNLVMAYIPSAYVLTKRFSYSDDVFLVDFSPDGRHIATGGNGEYCRIFDVTTETDDLRASLYKPETSTISFSPNGNQIAAGSAKEISIWETQTARLWYNLNNNKVGRTIGKTSTIDNITRLSFSPDNQHIVAGDDDGNIHRWDLKTRTQDSIGSHDGIIYSISFNQNGQYLATAFSKGACIWNVLKKQIVYTVVPENEKDGIYSAALSPDNQHILTAHKNKTAHIRDIEGNALMHRFSGHTDELTTASYHPNGESIITASHDKTVRLWDIRTGATTHIFMGHERIVEAVSPSPDGTHIVTASGKTVRLWSLRYCALPESTTGLS